MSRPIILSVGSVNVDFQVPTHRRPEPSETPPGGGFPRAGGGKGANRGLTTRRLGAPAAIVARLGEDALAPSPSPR